MSPRLGAEDGPRAGRGLALLPGHDGEEQPGGQEEGQGEAAHGRGQVRPTVHFW